jgi:hypothetical protein
VESSGQPTQIANARAALAAPASSTFAYGVFCSEWIPYEPQSDILAKGLIAFPTYPDSVLSQAPQLPFEIVPSGTCRQGTPLFATSSSATSQRW